MDKESGQLISSEMDDSESQMRRGLGLEQRSSSAPVHDPLKVARQAIRSQSATRDYFERQFAQAESALNEMRAKLRSNRQERDAAVTTARNAIAANRKLETALASTEAELRAERSKREHSDHGWREAQVTVQDLRDKLEAAGRKLMAVKAELADERDARQHAERQIKALEISLTTSATQVAEVCLIDPAPAPQAAEAIAETGEVSPIDPETAEMGATEPVPEPAEKPKQEPRRRGRPSKEASGKGPEAASTKAANRQPPQKVRSKKQFRGDQEPVQWWLNLR